MKTHVHGFWGFLVERIQQCFYSWFGLPLERFDPVLRNRHVYVVCNDTLVENPRIAKFIHVTLDHIQKSAAAEGVPISVQQTSPRLEDTFWVNLLGKGYPAPNNTFRWCTDKAFSSWIEEQMNKYS